MPSASEAAEMQAILGDLTTLATRDIVELWARVDALPPDDLRDYLLAALPDLLDPYAAAAGAYGVQWYENADPTSTFRARPAAMPDRAALEASTRWAISPLYGVGIGSALVMLTGVGQRAIANVARRTAIENSERESGATYARHAAFNACTFCALSAVDPARSGHKFHDSCRCVTIAVRPGQSFEPAGYTYRWQNAYRRAARETGSNDTTQILSHMRANLALAH